MYLKQEHRIPGNGPYLIPPGLNLEKKASSLTPSVSRNSASIQTQLSIRLVPLGKAIITIISSGEARPDSLLGDLNDTSSLLLNLLFSVLKQRWSLLLPGFDKALKETICTSIPTDLLLDANLADHIHQLVG